jgi:hypothetical protein
MATKQYYATGSFRYGTRMLTAGDPVEMDAPTARLFTALNKITERRPANRKPAEPVEEEAKPQRTPRKRTRKAK